MMSETVQARPAVSAPRVDPARRLRVVIEAQVTPGTTGGLEPYLMALAAGLRDEAGDAWSYTLVAASGHSDWLRPFVGDDHEIVGRPPSRGSRSGGLQRWLGPARGPAGRAWRRTLQLAGRSTHPRTQPSIVRSDGFLEALQPDVVHFPYVAHYEQSACPSVVTIHDLQHRHFPQFFSESHLQWREAAYPAALAHAAVVVADSEWVRADIVRQYGTPGAKIASIPPASSLRFHARPTREFCERLRTEWRLPDAFALYPAMTYAHKNHLRLLEAVARLRDRGRTIHVVCPGKQDHIWPAIRTRLQELRLESQVTFTGFIRTDQLLGLYQLAQFVVFPSLFEGAGLPVLEALEQGVPVTCSDIPSLREYAADGVLWFDPARVDEIEQALDRMATDALLRDELRDRALRRAALFTPQEMARRHQSVYRRACGRESWPTVSR